MFETLTLAAILVPCLILAIVFHEVAHGWVALALGDTTARDLGRLTLNPIKHVDLVGTLLVPGALALMGGPVFRWAKPVPVNARRLGNPRFGMMAVAAAGPGTNILLALVGAVTFGVIAGFAMNWGAAMPEWVMTAFGAFIVINVFLALFNMLPIPPFDGSHILGGLLPRRWAHHWQKLQAMGMLLFMVLIAATWAFPESGWIENTIGPPVEWLTGQFYSVADGISRFIA
jgi:Zn-dependent protease